MTQDIDRFPVKNLPNRYGINRSVLYTRIEKLDIKTTKEGNKSYIDGEALKRLDKLDKHLKNGGTTSQFLDQTDRQYSPTDRQDTIKETPKLYESENQTDKLDRQDKQTGQLSIKEVFDQLITTALEATENKRSGLNDLRDLQEIADNKWLIPTSRLSEIIGRSRSYFTGKKEINYCGFHFQKVGKQGNESLWQVIRE